MKEYINNLLDYIYNSKYFKEISEKFKFLPDYENGKCNQSSAEGNSILPSSETDLIIITLHAVVITMKCMSGFVNYRADASGRNRAAESEQSDFYVLEKELYETYPPDSFISFACKKMLDAVGTDQAFNPKGNCKILKTPGPLLAVLRTSPDGKDKVLCLLNISGRILKLFAYWEELGSFNNGRLYDIINSKESAALVILADEEKKQGTEDSGKNKTGSECSAMINLDPWEVVWLK